jgi:hypothetical protein
MRIRYLLLLFPLVLAACAKAPVAERAPSPNPGPGAPEGRIELEPTSSEPGGESPEVEEFLDRKERWVIKVAGDPDARRIDASRPQVTTVAALSRLERPEGMSMRGDRANRRVFPVEGTVYTVEAEIVRHKLVREDQDLHVVIRDYGGNPSRTMIVEIPDPTFVPRASPFRERIAEVRQEFYARLKPTTKFRRTKVRARITGIGFFDFKHGQSGIARNGIELHPVIGIEYR